MAESTGSPVLRNRCAADAIISMNQGDHIVNVAIVINDAICFGWPHLRLTHSQIIPDMNLVEPVCR
jgi:hypothetical protein